MQPYNGGGGGGGGGGSNNRAEAERWVGIAEKLLAGRDLVGTKTFAIRARESDPRFDAADLILAVADTLLASEKQINNQPDWYSILQLPTLCLDMDLIANQYRRLALLLNPHKNRLPYADQAFTMVSYAWSVLSDPNKKFLYDNEINNMFTRFEPTPPNRPNEINLQFVQNPIQQQQPPPQFPPVQPPPQWQQLPPTQHHHRPNLPPFQSQIQHHPQQFPPGQLQNQHLTPQVPHFQPPKQPQLPTQTQTQQHVVRENPVNEQVQPNRSMEDKDASEESEGSEEEDEESTFWTACPYCYYMYEYPGVYKGCTFRCHNCKRAFHGLKIESPPSAALDGKDSYFCCWGFIPLAGSMTNPTKKKKRQDWSPFSQMIPCPPAVKKAETRKQPPADDNEDKDDIFLDVSSSDNSSDGDWRSNSASRKKKAKYTKETSQSKNVNNREADKGKNVEGDPQNISMAAESSRKGASSSNNLKKVQSNVPKEWGRLDLNVEFSNNETEESGSGVRVGGGAGSGRPVHAEEEDEEEDEPEEGIEGIGFFEGLDDFLSSLPILNVVGEDNNKVKAA
ncbi:chromodomain-helicase-DNA-binding protein 7-like [Impatiens glandulifera]|uniref:chromodomain-helicase-DNA-binding protein 7-like n=1 Tax=Impatiens glandulifera TaxID=253017 RepID=UPI001FB0C703|nr:chromodomain-helicase-DNA-binding protein 7-like [Impatiens glandulifera]